MRSFFATVIKNAYKNVIRKYFAPRKVCTGKSAIRKVTAEPFSGD